VADWRGLLDALSYTGPGAMNSLARNTANSLMSGEEPAYRYYNMPFTEDKSGNTSFGWPELALPAKPYVEAIPSFAANVLDSFSPFEINQEYGTSRLETRYPPVVNDILGSLNRAQDQAQGRMDEDGNFIKTRGLDTINAGSLAPLGVAAGGAVRGAAGGGKALAAGLAANRVEASAAPLAMDQASRLSRARDMGFDTDRVFYHGSNKDFSSFDPDAGVGARAGTGSWFTDDPDIAASYASRDGSPSITPVYLKDGKYVNVSAEGRNWQMLDGQTDIDVPMGRNVDYGRLEDYVGIMGDEYASTNDVAAWARKNGQDGARFQNIKDRGPFGNGLENVEATNVAVFDPRNIRSVNATFDPSKSDSANLLAANSEKAAAPLALNALEGQPIRAYRGMQMDRQQGAKSDTMFGSSDPEVAASYANQVEDPRFGSSFESGAMMPLDMNFNNPMRVDAGGNYWSEIPYNGDFASTDQLVSKARALGHDGLIVDNVKDALTRGSEPATTYAAIGRGTVRSPLTGETLFSNKSAAPLALNALDGQAPKGIKAYHGSPHDFDKFSLDAIGTGEGAQAYGHGLYFADSEDVAKSYRDRLTPKLNIDGQNVNHGLNGADAAQKAAADLGAPFEVQNTLRWYINRGHSVDDMIKDLESTAPEWADKIRGIFSEPTNPGRMYEVNINANPDDLLDWDKPLFEQSPKFKTR
jgi:hypothetical protein